MDIYCSRCGLPAAKDERIEAEETCMGGGLVGDDGALYRDIHGRFVHDPNCVSGVFECPHGHRFTATVQHRCTCGWSNERRCTITGHDKIRLLQP